jgi:FkbM family methyltransferase
MRYRLARGLCPRLPPLFARRASRAIAPRSCGPIDAPFRVRAQTGSFFTGTTRDQLAYWFSLVGYNEWRLWAAALVACQRGDTIVEVGANIGTETVGFSDIVGPTGRVIAIEPVPSSLKALSRAVAEFKAKNVHIVAAAASDKTGRVHMRVPPHKPSEAQVVSANDAREQDVAVDSVQIDDLSRTTAAPRLIAIDVEGFEVNVVRGSAQTIARFQPDLVVEANPRKLIDAGFSVDLLRSELERLGYSVYWIGRLSIRPVCRTTFPGYQNWFCTFVPERAATLERLIRVSACMPCISGLNPLNSPSRL